jgi:GTP-binding protein EngB required for normal cell division
MTHPDRTMIATLAEDIGWLERHAMKRPERADRAVSLRFAAALVRNSIGPTLAGRPARPLHVAVVGGAGTGKSTVANLIVGSALAEANPQAGFTRHPIAYSPTATADWATHDGLLGGLRRLTAPAPASLDEDVYQIRIAPRQPGPCLLDRYVVWDCPDMTTWAAAGYAPRLLEVAGLADVIVFVASDERYNDAVPTQYLRLFLEAGKPVVVVLTKMKPEQAEPLLAHFRKEVLHELPRGRITLLTVPYLTAEELAEPGGPAAAKHRIPLVNQLSVLAEDPERFRALSAAAAARHLKQHQDALLAVARDDIAAVEDWTALVDRGRKEFLERYAREYLTSAKFHRFDEALVKLVDMLELPGVGKYLAQALHVVRTPYRLAKSLLGNVFGSPAVPAIPEQPVLDECCQAWADQVRATALTLEKQHELWAKVAHGFETDLGGQLKERYRAGLAAFQGSQRAEIDATARAIYEDLEKSPGTLHAFRAGKFAIDAAAIGGAVFMGGLSVQDFILVPLAAGISQQLVEWAGAGYVDMQKEKARERQKQLVDGHIATPLAEWLTQWPASGGSDLERLQLALKRIPGSLDRLVEALPA